MSAANAADDGGPVDRQTVAVNLVLVDDAALGGVVGALAGMGSQILALRKSEPSLEDVFVELVGRGFGEEDGASNGTGRPPGDGPPADRRGDDAHATSDDAEASEVA